MKLRTFFVLAVLAWAMVLMGATALAQPGSRLDAPPRDELDRMRPLAQGGAAALVYYPDAGPGARITVLVPVAADAAVVRGALLAAERWPEFIPALRSVSLLSRRGRRAAFRFEVSASLLDATASVGITEVNPRRVDLAVQESDFGVAAARWDLLDDGPGRTLVVITSWSDPSQGHWLLRQTARSNLTATAGMNVAVDLILALSVGRRALDLAGTHTPPRPPRVAAHDDALAPPEHGPWEALTDNPRRYYVYAFRLAEDGAVSQMTVVHQTWGRADVLQQRLEDLVHYHDHLPGVQVDEGASVERAALRMSNSLDSASGLVVRRTDTPGAILLEGRTGSLRGARWRWDVTRTPDHGTLLALTSDVGEDLAGTIVRAAAGREPYIHAGVAALRDLMWMRYMLAGVPF